MHQKQLYVDYLTIDPETMDQAESAALRRISRYREKINLLRRLTALNGRYITKRLDDELQARFPEYSRVFVGKTGTYSNTISVYFCGNGHDLIAIEIASLDNRRASLTMINGQIEALENEIAEYQTAMQNFRENAAQWNNLMNYAATIYGPLYSLLINCKDYRAEHICRL